MFCRYTIPQIYLATMGVLGFYRGVNLGIYTYNKYNRMHSYKYNAMYIPTLCYGLYGIVIYINPVLLPFIMYKELYRLEVNLRNLELLDEDDYYNLI